MRSALAAIVVFAWVALVSPILVAQWPSYPTKGVPRADGKPNLTAAPPRTADGVPDLSGIWNYAGVLGFRGGPPPPPPGTPVQATFWNIEAGFKEGLPFTPWGAELRRKRMADNSKDNPDAACLPLGHMQLHTHSQPRKIVQTRDLIVIIYEANANVRQIFLDGRPRADQRSAAVVVRLRARLVGRRHAGRRNDELPRRRVARCQRRAVVVIRKAHRAFPSSDLRHAGDRRDDRRSKVVHETVDRPRQSASAGRHRAHRVRLQREPAVQSSDRRPASTEVATKSTTTLAMALSPGARRGPYEITAKIGAGGMGEVYRARDTKLDRDVALKILPEAFASDPERLARFEREAKTLAALNHPHIAHIHGLEESDGVLTLVLEFVDGPTLADRIAHGPIPINEALPIARQIAEALEAAHDQGIIHRDLKPENIKVRTDGTVKVLDFGLAKALDPTAAATADVTASPTITVPALMTGAGMIVGTAAYMSPEQARGKAVDRRTDLWAFGCVLFEMLTGRRVFPVRRCQTRSQPSWSGRRTGLRCLQRRRHACDTFSRVASKRIRSSAGETSPTYASSSTMRRRGDRRRTASRRKPHAPLNERRGRCWSRWRPRWRQWRRPCFARRLLQPKSDSTSCFHAALPLTSRSLRSRQMVNRSSWRRASAPSSRVRCGCDPWRRRRGDC